MDELKLSAELAAKQEITALCFYSALPDKPYQTVLHSASLSALRDAIDNSMTDKVYVTVNNEHSKRLFMYGTVGDKIQLVETCLLTLGVVEGFSPLNMRAASWRQHVQPVAA